jgi:hypothetical protein
MSVKKLVAPFAALLLLAACGKKTEVPKGPAPEAAHAPSVPALPAPPAEAVAGKDPHAGLERQAINPGTGRKGKVLETMNSAGYTYLRVDEKGASVWLAVMEIPVKVGDTVEFPNVPPMNGFRSRTLNRTFESILFVPGVRVERSK